jgi:hypothetical protein
MAPADRQTTKETAMKTSLWKAALLGGAIALAAPAQAQNEVAELKMMSQYGIGYMQLTVVKAEKMIEKHLARAGLPNTKVTWATLGAGAAANDALLSGGLHFAAGGTGPAFILWDRTRGTMDVRGVAALSSMPNLLVTRNPNIKTVRDFTDKDRIAMAGAGSSVQTIYLQMAVAKEFGPENFRKLADEVRGHGGQPLFRWEAEDGLADRHTAGLGRRESARHGAAHDHHRQARRTEISPGLRKPPRHSADRSLEC